MSTIQTTSPDCAVCKNNAQDNIQINVGTLLHSASTSGCQGCVFLYHLSNQVHDSIRGRSMDASQVISVNCGLLFPPKEFLLLPMGNVIAQTGKIEVFKTHPRGDSCPWPTIKQSTITSGDTGSERCHDTIKAWLNECVESHNSCKQIDESLLPTRVLDLGDPAAPLPTISLLESQAEQRGVYCCLSHRWIDKETPTTTKHNLQDRKQGISITELPAKYQDAITFTRSLNIRYLWIDSLCIIQSSPTDWIREAPKMAAYYGNAHLTISAANATSPGQRLFSEAQSGTGTLNIANGTELLYAVHYRLPLPHTENPLHARGWVFQEYMLSRRVVHFCSEEVIWECRQGVKCECSRVNDDLGGTLFVGPISDSAFQSFAYRRKARFYESLHKSPSKMRLKNLWMELVHEYSKKQLTFGTDVFPAIAGLAKEISSVRKCKYLAGLWEDSLVSDLLWEAETEEWYPEGYRYAKPEKWRAPSWSWASSTAVINWPYCPIDSTTGEFVETNVIGEVFVKNLRAECKSVGEDGFMGVEKGVMEMTGTLSTTPIVRNKEKGYDVLGRTGEDSLALDHTLTEEEMVDPVLLRAVRIASITVGGESFVSLLLKPTGKCKNEFERIGLLHHDKRLRDVEVDTRITIV